MYKTIVIVTVLLAIVRAQANCSELNLLPMPFNCTMASDVMVVHDPCAILYKLLSVPLDQRAHFHELLDHYQRKTFNCSGANYLHVASGEEMLSKRMEYTVRIKVEEAHLKSVFSV
jgi:hypothetical protein